MDIEEIHRGIDQLNQWQEIAHTYAFTLYKQYRDEAHGALMMYVKNIGTAIYYLEKTTGLIPDKDND